MVDRRHAGLFAWSELAAYSPSLPSAAPSSPCINAMIALSMTWLVLCRRWFGAWAPQKRLS